MISSSFRILADNATARLNGVGVENARREAWLLLAAASGLGRAALMAHGDEAPDDDALARFAAMLGRRIAREPLAYILREKEFWSLSLRIEPGVLVPRPDSETLVEAALARLPDRSAPLRILDLGTGSGCLLLALLSELPNARGLGVDLDPLACSVAHDNARRLDLGRRVTIVRGDWAEAIAGPFDLIVSNPPYIRRTDLADLAPEIREHEPAHALAAGPDGLDAYRLLAPAIVRLLAAGGTGCLEHGHDQAAPVRRIMARHGLIVLETRRDLAGQHRACVVKKRAETAAA